MAITDDFLPALLGQANIGENMRNQIALAVKRASLGIPDPTRTLADNYAASVDCSELLVESLFTEDPLDILAHQKHSTNSQKSSKERLKAKRLGQLADLKPGINKNAAMQMDRACKSGAWLTVMPSFMDDTELSAQVFRDSICWRLGLAPLRLPTDCGGCRAPFSVEHAYQCKIGGIINLRHNILADDWRVSVERP